MSSIDSMAVTSTTGITYGTTTTGTTIKGDYYTGTPYVTYVNTPKIEWGKYATYFKEDEVIIETKKGNKSLGEYIKERFEEYKNMNMYDDVYITDLNVYGFPNPKVVEVIFKRGDMSNKVKAICDKNDKFDLEYGIYIAIAKYFWGKQLTIEGIETKAKELSMFKEWDKAVKKVIKNYYTKLKNKEESEKKKAEERAAKLRRREKNRVRKQRKKDRSKVELKKLIYEAMTD